MATRAFRLQFPLKGLDRRYAFWQQPPYTSPDACNVRPDSTIKGRERGGSRPGIGKAFAEELGSGTPLRMLHDLTYVKGGELSFQAETFSGSTLATAWTTASWIGHDAELMADAAATPPTTMDVGNVYKLLSTLDTAQAYSIEAFLAPYEGAWHGNYSLFGRMNDVTPVVTTDGIHAELTMTGSSGAYTGNLYVYVASVLTTYAFTGGTIGHVEAGWFKVLVTVDNIKVYWQGTLLLNQAIAAQAGTRVGFGLECTTAGGAAMLDQWRTQYYPTGTSEPQRNIVMASAGGTLYRESRVGELTAVVSDETLASDRMLQATEHLQKLYIADHGDPKVDEDDGVVTDDELTSVSVADWTALGLNTYDDVCVVYNALGTTINGTYQIDTVAVGNITLTTSPGTGTCSFRIARGPKVFDPADDSLALWTATSELGQVPNDCPLVCTYRDRLVLAGNPAHQWYMSRQGDPLDWQYLTEVDDLARAVSGLNADAGQIGDVLTALIPFGDDYLIFGCLNSIWVLRGDPVYGGEIENLDRAIGVVDKKAWCYGPAGEVIFLSRDGLYGLAGGSQSRPQSISREVLPRELLDVNTSLCAVNLAYDARDRGVAIFLTPNDSTGSLHWWFDWESKGFSSCTYQSDHEPTVVYKHTSTIAEDTAVLFGCRDGYIRRSRQTLETDEGNEIASYVLLGPFINPEAMKDFRIDEIAGTLAEGSGDVTWSLLLGAGAESAANASAFATGTWSAGQNYTVRPQGRGRVFFLKLENGSTDRAWSLEHIDALARSAGIQRKA